ncbi:hypothetical protein EDD18DRAFT_1106058 [Armillaria luteobubalina]|uniref:Uncharacterized protein n=1 Tax=Armillaria luteobubalina TaxID=153913 RepID=A0AA39TNU0_9AGAR|nr:hypothetical protein EDD18DRAFT_1106058 [Armillaria luteobubalina]
MSSTLDFIEAPPFKMEPWPVQEYDTLIMKAKRDMKKTWMSPERDVLVPLYPDFKAACKAQDPHFDKDGGDALKNWVVWRIKKLKHEHETGTKPGAIAKLFSNWKDTFKRDFCKDITEHHLRHCMDSPRAPPAVLEKAIKELTRLVACRVTGKELYLADHSDALDAALATSEVTNNAGKIRRARSQVLRNTSEEELEAYDERAAKQDNKYAMKSNHTIWPQVLQLLLDGWSRGPVGLAQITLILAYKEDGVIQRAIHSDEIPGFSESLSIEEKGELMQKFSAYAEQVLPNDVARIINDTRPSFHDNGPESLKQHLVDVWKYTHRHSKSETPRFPWADMASSPKIYFDTVKYVGFSVSDDALANPFTMAAMSGDEVEDVVPVDSDEEAVVESDGDQEIIKTNQGNNSDEEESFPRNEEDPSSEEEAQLAKPSLAKRKAPINAVRKRIAAEEQEDNYSEDEEDVENICGNEGEPISEEETGGRQSAKTSPIKRKTPSKVKIPAARPGAVRKRPTPALGAHGTKCQARTVEENLPDKPVKKQKTTAVLTTRKQIGSKAKKMRQAQLQK